MKTRRYHPICHLINGERLYFFLIRSAGDLDRAKSGVQQALKESGLESSSCAYLIFGEYDFVIRFWATQTECCLFENTLYNLKHRQDIEHWRKLFISTLSTWIQRDIEAAHSLGNNRTTLNTDVLKSVWGGKVDDRLAYTIKDDISGHAFVRFFMTRGIIIDGAGEL